MALKKCKECGQEISSDAKICPNCGKMQGISTSVGCLIIIVVIILIALISQNPPSYLDKKNDFVENSATVQDLSVLSASEHLEKAKKALSDGYKPHKDIMKKSWGNVSLAKEHLLAIKQTDREYDEAQKLLKVVREREKEIDQASKLIAAQVAIKMRENFARDYENNLLSQGMDVEVSLSGAEKKNINIKYVLMSRPLVYKLVNEGQFLENLKMMGFSKVVLDDGYGKSWTYKLD